MVTGNRMPGVCGVGDYTERLATALRSLGLEIDLLSANRWVLTDVIAADKKLDKIRPEITHLQYPMPGAGHKLGPQILAMKRSSVVTLHEGSQSHFLRKLSLFPFALRASHLIFTSEFERQFVMRWAPWISLASSVIPIGSNIRKGALDSPSRCRNEVVYFGLIMPAKGIEDVLRLAALIKNSASGLTVRIVGNPSAGHEAYFEDLHERSRNLPVVWEAGLNDEQVANRLARCSVGYLPFPDGVSERRASLKAMLLNGMAVVTTRGAHTFGALDEIVEYSDTPQQAYAVVRRLLESPSRQIELGRRGVEYMRQFGWDTIAQLHLRVYEKVIRERTSDRRLLCPN
jgi:glycosyltransferase involved in cell wall biosynthesis